MVSDEIQNPKSEIENPREILPEKEEPWKPDFSKAPQADIVGSQQSGVGSQEPGPESRILNPESSLLDLSAPERTVKLRSGEKRYVHVFNPPTAEDWLEFERRARATQIFRGDEVETVTRLREAALALWEKRINRVDGYTPSAAGDFAGIPSEHRIQAVLGLDRVELNTEDTEAATEDTETKVVVLQARWNGEFFPALVHRFKRPLVEHELRFSEAAARSTIVLPRGPRLRNGKPDKDAAIESRRLPSLPTLIALYDEMIVGVEGYADGNSKLEIRNSVIAKMDAPHKSAAVRALFATEAVALDEEN
jgi:hypothetical protein